MLPVYALVGSWSTAGCFSVRVLLSHRIVGDLVKIRIQGDAGLR